jgi:HK97 family phage major capsid protein
MYELRQKKAELAKKMADLALSKANETPEDRAARIKAFDDAEAEVATVEKDIDLLARAQAAAVVTAKEHNPLDGSVQAPETVPATPETNKYVKEKSLVIGGIVKMLGAEGGNARLAKDRAHDLYGESHPVTKALGVSTGTGGGYLIPPDYVAELIELLRPATVVRASNPRVMAMPRGTMTLPGQATPAIASYQGENQKVASSQQTFDQIVATYKKLTALVPVSNDMMRYADPAIDAVVRDDLVKVIALREDLAFLLGDGTTGGPMGFLGFANKWVAQNGGTPGTWSTSANSTLAVNGSVVNGLIGSNGGNFITSTEAYTEATIINELIGAINKLDVANVSDMNRVWFMSPRVFNALCGLLNSLGLPVFPDLRKTKNLYGYPVKTTNQIPGNYYDGTGTSTVGSFIFLAEMTESMILDSMQLEIAVSREGNYVDTNGVTWSAFQNDQTLIRAIAEHDFQLRHSGSVAVIQNVQWEPAIQ